MYCCPNEGLGGKSYSMKIVLLTCYLLILLAVGIPDVLSHDHRRVPPIGLRRLAVGDFKELNELFVGAEIVLPLEGPIKKTLAGTEFTVSDIRCRDLNIGDLILAVSSLDNDFDASLPKVAQVDFEVVDLDITCTGDFRWKLPSWLGGLGGGDNVVIKSTDSDASIKFTLESTRGAGVEEPRVVVQVSEPCRASMRLDVDVNGGPPGVTELAEFLDIIDDQVGAEIETMVCQELSALSEETLPGIFNQILDDFDPYLQELNAERRNPLFQEEELDSVISQDQHSPDYSPYMNFQNPPPSKNASAATELVSFVLAALDQADVWLGKEIKDDVTGETTLGVNLFLRDFVLDENRAFTWDMSSSPVDNLLGSSSTSSVETEPGGGLVLLENHDELLQMSITLENMKITGLDTITEFSTLERIGKQTLQNVMQWDSLSAVMNLTFHIVPSTLEDSLWSRTKDVKLFEQVQVQLSAEQLRGVVSLFLAIHQDDIGEIPLGALFQLDSAASCVLSAIYQGHLVSGFDVSVSDLSDPQIVGFTSVGLDRVLTEAMELMYDMYEHWILQAIPTYSQTRVRDSMNSKWVEYVQKLQKDKAEACPLSQLPETGDDEVVLLDFRDLLLPPEEALAEGGAGQEPYGDVVHTLFSLIDDVILAPEKGSKSDLYRINSLLIDPLTEGQSGEKGVIHFPSKLLSLVLDYRDKEEADDVSMSSEIAASLVDYLEFCMYDIKFENFNTISSPSYVLNTTGTPYSLGNQLLFWPEPEQHLKVTFRLKLTVDTPQGLESKKSDASDRKESIMRVSLSSRSLGILTELFATVDARRLQRFPVEDISNVFCWLALIATPALNEDGLLLQEGDGESDGQLGLRIKSFFADFMGMDLDVQCANNDCLESGLGILSDLMKIWRDSEVTKTLGERLETLMADFLTGDYFNLLVGRWLYKAPTMCPHDAKYDTTIKEFPPLGLPSFSSESIDTLIFTAFIAAEAGFLVLSETYRSNSGFVGAEGPMSIKDAGAGNTAGAAENSRLFDFYNTNDSYSLFSDIVNHLLRQARISLGSDSEGSEPGINSILRGQLTEDGVLDIQFRDPLKIERPNLQLQLNAIKVIGIDDFEHFDIMEATSSRKLQNSFRLKELAVEANLSVVSGSDLRSNIQNIVVSLEVEDIQASFAVDAAIDAEALESLELGSLMDLKDMIPCIFTAVREMHISQMDFSIKNVKNVAVEGLFPESDAALSRSLIAITKQFGTEIDGFLNPILRAIINGVFSSYKKGAKCVNKVLESTYTQRRLAEPLPFEFLDFRDLFLSEELSKKYGGTGESPYGNVFRSLFSFLQDMIMKKDPLSGLPNVNKRLVGPLTKAISNDTGSLLLSEQIIDTKKRIQVGGLDTLFTFRATNAKVEHLDSLGAPISLLSPMINEANKLNSTATFGVTSDRPLVFSVRLLLGLEGEQMQIRNDFQLSLDLHVATIFLTALLEVATDRFAKFPVGNVFDADCWLASIPAPSLDSYGFIPEGERISADLSQLAASASDVNLRIKCFSCTSPGLDSFNTQGSDDIAGATQRVLNYLSELLGGKFLRVEIDRALNDAARRCPHSPEYDPSFTESQYDNFKSGEHQASTSYLLMLLLVTSVLLVILLVVSLTIRCFVRRRHQRWLRALPNAQLYLIQREQKKEKKKDKELNDATNSLFRSSAAIPLFVRYFIPLVICANIAFFLSGHLSLGASVNIEAQLAGQSFLQQDFFTFSMAQSTIDIWNAGGKPLAALIFILSGLWPYTKQLITLALWFLPPSRVSLARRESILLWLDTLGKWSMVDIFVLLVSIAGFRVSIVSPDLDFLPYNFYAIDLLVIPKWGLYANMIAQIVSQISSHFIIHYHRKVVQRSGRVRHALKKTATFLQHEETSDRFSDEGKSLTSESYVSSHHWNSQKECLYQHTFLRPHNSDFKLVTRSYVNPLLVMGAVLLIALLIAGCVLPSFSLEILGILGLMVESGNRWKQAITDHSVFTITDMLMEEAEFLGHAGGYVGMGSLSALLVFTVLVVPLVETTALLYHWFAPMTKSTRRRLEIFLETVQAWQYVEVYLIATVVASWQLGPLSTYMINAYCGSLQDTFSILVYYGILRKNDAQCFRVDASISSAAYLLAASAILLALLNAYVINASRQYFRDIEAKMGQTTEQKSESTDNEAETKAMGNRSFQRPGLESRGNSLSSIFPDDPDAAAEDPLAEATRAEVKVIVDDDWNREEAIERIDTVPVLFSDKFRWTLRALEASRMQPSLHANIDSVIEEDGDVLKAACSEEKSLLTDNDSSAVLHSPVIPYRDTNNDEVISEYDGDNAVIEKFDDEDNSDKWFDGIQKYSQDNIDVLDSKSISTLSNSGRDDDSAVLIGRYSSSGVRGGDNIVLAPNGANNYSHDADEVVNEGEDKSYEDVDMSSQGRRGIRPGLFDDKFFRRKEKPVQPLSPRQGNSLLQAALMEDVDDIPPIC